MSKRVFNKWFKTYRNVTEVDFDGVDQWEDGDVEIAFIEGYWTGRRDSADKLMMLPRLPRGVVGVLQEQVAKWQKKLDTALAKRGNRLEVGGADYEAYEEKQKTQSKPRPPSMSREVALCKFHAMTKGKKIIMMDKAMKFMEDSEGYSKDYAIACTVAEEMNVELRS